MIYSNELFAQKLFFLSFIAKIKSILGSYKEILKLTKNFIAAERFLVYKIVHHYIYHFWYFNAENMDKTYAFGSKCELLAILRTICHFTNCLPFYELLAILRIACHFTNCLPVYELFAILRTVCHFTNCLPFYELFAVFVKLFFIWKKYFFH